ncbi:bifunctional polysaccharide deacetylase/glycosyltransferase family 2 protein [Streptomyces sp. NPDC016309]|uniref:bifunctional polysaccharide deacetylase/glycosyltransferase family 2 protein n=1 Tax=Streptomyces sp. NPDC016309 TaxID=3364965 RepID=UPI003700049B
MPRHRHRHRNRHRRDARRVPHIVPRPRVVLGLLCLLAMTCMLLLNSHLSGTTKSDPGPRKRAPADQVPISVREGGPIIFEQDGRLVSRDVPRKTVVLTFDDGPDARWTPKVLRILEKHDVPATFFLIGQSVVRESDLVRRMVDEGHEIGAHTFTHIDLTYQSRERVNRELAETQLAFAGAVDRTTSLMRTPYSSEVGAIGNDTQPILRSLAAKGYITVFVNTDSNDWRKPGISSIIRQATPRNGQGAVVLFHDAGGDRTQTVLALDGYIAKMKSEGYTFTTISDVLHTDKAVQEATGWLLWKGKAMMAVSTVTMIFTPVLTYLLYTVGALVILRFVMMLILAHRHHRRHHPKTGRPPFSWGREVTEPVSVLVPAYNEGKCIAKTLRSLAAGTHPVEVIVVDDGSTDDTADIAEALAAVLPGVRVVRQRNAGKSAALNTGIRHARHDLIVMMDGDTVFEPSTVHELVQPFADARVGAVSGNAKVGNRGSVLGAWQHIEYVMGFSLDRRMYDVLGCIPVIPGAVGAFRRRALRRTGGMSTDTLAEDTDVTIAMHRDGWRVVYQDTAIAWTEAPGTLRQLWRQRYRWSYGTMQALWKHRRCVIERGPSGRFGRVGMPLVVLFTVVAPLLSPLIDIFTIYGIIAISPWKSIAAWSAVLVLQFLCALYAFHLDKERYGYLVMLPLQQFVYRQLMYLVLLHALVTAATGGRLRWQKIRRTGDVPLTTPVEPAGPRPATGPPAPAGAHPSAGAHPLAGPPPAEPVPPRAPARRGS